jgi:hypothetical protein
MVQDEIGKRIEEVLVMGNLSALNPIERTEYYQRLCASLGLDPLTQPLTYLTLNGKLVLYANRACAEQLRRNHGVSISEPKIEYMDDLVMVTVNATDNSGRQDSDMGVVAIGNLKGEARANALLKAVTKAKRRVTLSICGLGMLDETEVEDIPASAKRDPVAMPTAKPVDQRIAAPAELPGVQAALSTEEPAISRFWKATRQMGLKREDVVAVTGELAFETLDDDTLGELLLQLKDRR